MFAVITPLLMTGAVAERIRFKMFIVLIVFWEVVVYYPVAHWYGDGRRGWRYLLAVPRNHANQRATTTTSCPKTYLYLYLWLPSSNGAGYGAEAGWRSWACWTSQEVCTPAPFVARVLWGCARVAAHVKGEMGRVRLAAGLANQLRYQAL